MFRWEVVSHPQYSKDNAPSKYLFASIDAARFSRALCYQSSRNKKKKNPIDSWIASKDEWFFHRISCLEDGKGLLQYFEIEYNPMYRYFWLNVRVF